jgi:hypothetical protein
MADDTELVQDWLNRACNPATVERLPLLTGTYEISDTLTVANVMGAKLRGAAGQNRSRSPERVRCCTVLKWVGPPDKPMMHVIGCSGLVMEGINFDGDPAVHLQISHGVGCLNIALRDMGFLGGGVGIQCGTRSNEWTAANVTYDNCHFQEQSEACVRIINNQSLEHLFLRPQFAWSPIAIDVQGGGDITSVGGGSFEMKAILNLGRIGSNARGFDIRSLRVDGEKTRTAWLTASDPTAGRSYGTVGFDHCTQNNGQQESDMPLLTVPPGCRVVASKCGFHGSQDNWAEMFSDRRMHSELIVEYCDGISGNGLERLVTANGPNAWQEFRHCGNLYGPSGSYSTFPVNENN